MEIDLQESNIPYEFLKKEKEKLDNAQLYTLIKTENIAFLHPDKATSIFSYYFNSNKFEFIDNQPFFESYIKLLKSMFTNIEFLHIKANIIADKNKLKLDNFKHEKIIMDYNKLNIFFLELDQGGFGHYGTAIYETNQLYLFDSMMRIEKHRNIYKITAEYKTIMLEILKKIGVPTKNYSFDLVNDKDMYSLEITGGALGVDIPQLDNMFDLIKTKEQLDWTLKNYILGPDNQNQFCYMWAIFYITIKIFKYNKIIDDDFKNIHRKICEKNIIPVAFIKSFLLNLFKLKYITNAIKNFKDNDIDIYFFTKYFNKIISNSDNYKDVYNFDNKEFRMYEINSDIIYNDNITNNDKENLKNILIYFLKNIFTINKLLNTHDLVIRNNNLVNIAQNKLLKKLSKEMTINDFIQETSEKIDPDTGEEITNDFSILYSEYINYNPKKRKSYFQKYLKYATQGDLSYKNKYLKYKQKYLSLKNTINKL